MVNFSKYERPNLHMIEIIENNVCLIIVFFIQLGVVVIYKLK
jgi:hypothetical protein